MSTMTAVAAGIIVGVIGLIVVVAFLASRDETWWAEVIGASAVVLGALAISEWRRKHRHEVG